MDEQRMKHLRLHYSQTALDGSSCCGVDCCGDDGRGGKASLHGYTEDDVTTPGAEAFSGLGCGNPIKMAEISEGEKVLDLGCGPGFDVFLAANKVGASGMAIGVDMTPEMIDRARAVAKNNDIGNAQFRLGEIEYLPVADESVDVIISNCVINLSLAKPKVYSEMYRVLKPGGRIAISDVLNNGTDLPDELSEDVNAYCSCISGAVTSDEVRRMAADHGFVDVKITAQDGGDAIVGQWSGSHDLSQFIYSAHISATKPWGSSI